ncbi:hypothetical protein SUNI508_02710 [Seiridium unicorne]|uniref:DUF7514 domain-containing protein n=1 Tax=Seiridium unicorne TaxID=138068 RepID=A0ABR2VIE5_9PEZI
MDVPPPIPPRPPGYELRTPANPPLPPRPSPQQGQRPQQSFPPLPPLQRPQPQTYQGAYGGPPPVHSPRPPPPPSPSQPNQWSALHHPDGVATPLFEHLMAIVFAYLDPQKAGYIRPEVLSNFLDLSGFTLEHNIWKSNLTGNIMFPPEDIADAELKWACEAWRFDHKVVTRSPGRAQLPCGGMPLLSLRGFTDMMAVEHAGEPERAHRGLNAVLARYQIWPHLGPLPRECLLEERPAQVQRRVEVVTERGRRAAKEMLEANQARMRIQDEGRQRALELLDPPYVKRYYHY